MYEGSYRPRGSYTKLTTEWNVASRILFIAPLVIFDLNMYRLSVLTQTTLTAPWLTEKGGSIQKKKRTWK